MYLYCSCCCYCSCCSYVRTTSMAAQSKAKVCHAAYSNATTPLTIRLSLSNKAVSSSFSSSPDEEASFEAPGCDCEREPSPSNDSRNFPTRRHAEAANIRCIPMHTNCTSILRAKTTRMTFNPLITCHRHRHVECLPFGIVGSELVATTGATICTCHSVMGGSPRCLVESRARDSP
jgi:hypothetical protein